MKFFEFATIKPKKPMTSAQSVVGAKKRDVEIGKQALQSVKGSDFYRTMHQRP